MIREEYIFKDIADYLYDKNELLITGFPGVEERSKFFKNDWEERNKNYLLLRCIAEGKVEYNFFKNGKNYTGDEDLLIGIPRLLKDIKVSNKNVLIDLSCLDNTLIMFLTKVLLRQVVPKTLFASYIRPEHYSNQSENIGFSLSDKILGIRSVPGFTKRESENQTLCSFIGFEGIRLKNVLESVNDVRKFVPIVAFPSGALQWYNTTMFNGMDILQSELRDSTIHKCVSESIFDAINLLQEILDDDEKIVLVPLGTRPHSMACAIFACQRSNVRIIYDYVIENEHRAEGIAHIVVYHLSSFLENIK